MKQDVKYWRTRALEAEARLRDVPQVDIRVRSDDPLMSYSERSSLPIMIPGQTNITVSVRYQDSEYLFENMGLMEMKRW